MNKILIADRDNHFSQKRGECLERAGYGIHTVLSAEGAVEAFREHPFDLLLLTPRLPGKEETLETALAILEISFVPIIWLLDDPSHELPPGAERLPVYGCLVKTMGESVVLTTVRRVFSLASDAKQLNQSREELLYERDRFKQYLDVAEVMLLVIGTDKRVQLINRKGCRILGYDEQEITGRNWFQNFLAEEDVDDIETVFSRIISGEADSPEYHENWIRGRGAKPILMAWHNSLLRDSQGRIAGTLSSGEDITERRILSNRLAESEMNYRMLYLHAPLPYQSLDKEGRIIDVNPAWLKTLGYRRTEAVGKDFSSFLHPDWQDHFKKNFPLFKEEGAVHDVRFRIRHKSGEYREVSFEGRMGYWPDGQVKQSYCVFQDITEQQQTEERNALLYQELNHRVKNNIFMVSSLLKLKDKELGSGADLTDVINQIDAIQLIHRLLEKSSNIAEVNIREYLNLLLSTIFSTKPSTEISVTVDTAETLLPTKTAVTLGLIISELATNALKYGFINGNNGYFSIAETPDTPPETLRLRISNSGIPMAREMGGTDSGGLGLKLVHLLVRQLNGRIELLPARETTFLLTIPI